MPDPLAVFFRRLNGRYAQYLNARLERSGHLWQNRYFACALGRSHLPKALAYVDENPVRAGIVLQAREFLWSSAAAHQSLASSLVLLTNNPEWSSFWETGLPPIQPLDVKVLARCTYSGRPFGDETFVGECEQRFQRTWRNLGPLAKAAQRKSRESTGAL
jgi:putative transposase